MNDHRRWQRNSLAATRTKDLSPWALWRAVLGLFALSFLLGACSFPGSVKPTVKLGLSAPFEGLYRDQGYAVLHGVRLAVRNRNDAGGVGGRYLVELVALNDFNELEEARLQAGEMAADPGVLAVLGGWLPETAGGVAPEYRRRSLAFLAPETKWTLLGAEAARTMIEEMGLRRVIVLSGETMGDVALANAFAGAFGEMGGHVTAEVSPQGAGLTPAQIVVGLDEPEAVFLAADAASAARWMAETREAGFEGMFFGGPKLGSTLVPEIAGQASDGAAFVSHYPPLTDDADFVEGYLALSGGAPPGPEAEWAFASANRLLGAMEEESQGQGEPSRSGVLEALDARSEEEVSVFVYAIRSGEVFASYTPGGTESD